MTTEAHSGDLEDAGIVVTLYGRQHLFPDRDQARAFFLRPLDDRDYGRAVRALEEAVDLRADLLKATGGRGIPAEVMDEVLCEVDEH